MDDLALMTVVSFVLFMSAGITGPVNSLYVESLGASYVAIGLLGTVTSLTTILASYLWGQASDRLGRRKGVLVTGLAGLAASYGLIALVPSYTYLFALRVAAAVALSAYSTASLALMGDLLERHEEGRGRRMGVYRGLGSLGFGLMAFISGSVAERLTLRAPFALAGGLVVIALLIALRVREPPVAGSDHSPDGGSAVLPAFSFRSAWTQARAKVTRAFHTIRIGQRQADPLALPLAPLLVSSFLWAAVTGAVYAVWANYMVNEVGYSPAAMSRLWALASTSEFPLMVAAGWLSDRIGRLPVLSLSFLAWSLVFAGYVLAPGMPWIVLIQLTRGFAYSAFTATAMTYAAEVRARSERGRVSGLYSASGGAGSIVGSALGGLQAQFMGLGAMIATHAAIILGGAAYLAAAAVRRARSLRSGPPPSADV